jgi:hypothetical protein
MGKRKTAAAWRAFLRGLARTGNARAAAAEAGMDVGTAYDRRIKDAGFLAKWEEAVAKAKARPSPQPSPASGRGSQELVLRRTKHGDKLVAAAEGRWCQRVEDMFFAALARTGCVRSAAAAAGISTNALYYRRDKYPEFAERWRAVEEAAAQRLPGLLRAAGIASLDPEIADKGLPRVNIDQAIAISRLKGPSGGDGPRGRGIRPRVATNAEVREALTKALKAFQARVKKRQREERLEAGWTRTEEGHMIPPGWVRSG